MSSVGGGCTGAGGERNTRGGTEEGQQRPEIWMEIFTVCRRVPVDPYQIFSKICTAHQSTVPVDSFLGTPIGAEFCTGLVQDNSRA